MLRYFEADMIFGRVYTSKLIGFLRKNKHFRTGVKFRFCVFLTLSFKNSFRTTTATALKKKHVHKIEINPIFRCGQVWVRVKCRWKCLRFFTKATRFFKFHCGEWERCRPNPFRELLCNCLLAHFFFLALAIFSFSTFLFPFAQFINYFWARRTHTHTQRLFYVGGPGKYLWWCKTLIMVLSKRTTRIEIYWWW